MRALGYARVSTAEQADSGAGMDAQRHAIRGEVERRGWQLVDVVEDAGYSAKDLRRPGIGVVLERVARGDADVLVVSKLDRLSRSLIDFAQTMATAQREGWALVALDLGVDTATPGGEMMANVLASRRSARNARHLAGASLVTGRLGRAGHDVVYDVAHPRPKLTPARGRTQLIPPRPFVRRQPDRDGMRALDRTSTSHKRAGGYRRSRTGGGVSEALPHSSLSPGAHQDPGFTGHPHLGRPACGAAAPRRRSLPSPAPAGPLFVPRAGSAA